MKIRTKLTLLFSAIVIVVLGVVSLAIYYFSYSFRQQDFYQRLRNRAVNSIQLLVDDEAVDAARLRRMEKNNPASLPRQQIEIYNEASRPIYQSEQRENGLINDAMLRRMRAGEKEILTESGDTHVLFFVMSIENQTYYIGASAVDEYGEKTLRNLKGILVVAFITAALFVTIIGWFYAGRMLRPISQIVEEVESITERNLDKRVAVKGSKDELAKLANTFNAMLDRLTNIYFLHRNFISNASHEIKTPITVMSGEIEVALLQERDKPYYLRVLNSVLATLRSLNTVSTQLLALAQASANEPRHNFHPVRIDDVLWESKEELQRAFPSYTVDISFSINIGYGDVTIDGDEQLIKIAIINLMDNGCKYSFDRHVDVKLEGADESFVRIDFTNSGRTIAADNIDRIFHPFFRERSSAGKRGSGIGLSLVSNVVKLHGGNISVRSSNGVTTFSVQLPLSGRSVQPDAGNT